jgi:hypothetical protein
MIIIFQNFYKTNNLIPKKLVYYLKDSGLLYTQMNHWFEILKLLIIYNETYIDSSLLNKVCRDYKKIIDKMIELKVVYKESTKKQYGEVKYYTAPNIYTVHMKDLWYYDKFISNEYFSNEFNDIQIYTLKNIQLDKLACINLVHKKKKHLVLRFGINRRATKGKKVNRKYNSIISLPKVCRPYLSIDGKPFIETDIKNIQPMLLIILLINLNLPFDKEYHMNVVNGSFYESLFQQGTIKAWKTEEKRRFTYDLMNRDHIKELSYKDIFFGFKLKKNNLFINNFKNIYPITFSSMIKINDLASKLQNLEAEITNTDFLTTPHFTIHDALFATDDSVLNEWQDKVIERIDRLSKNFLILNHHNFKKNQNEKKDNFVVETDKIIELNFDKKIVVHKEHKTHKHSNESLIKQHIENGLSKKEIIELLNISERTYNRYKAF